MIADAAITGGIDARVEAGRGQDDGAAGATGLTCGGGWERAKAIERS